MRSASPPTGAAVHDHPCGPPRGRARRRGAAEQACTDRRVLVRNRNRIFLLMLVLVVGCGIGGITMGSRIYHRTSSGLTQLPAAASAYLDAVRDGDLEKAYQQLCRQVREHTTLQAFQANTRHINAYRLFDVKVINGTQGSVDVRLTLDDGAQSDQTIPFRLEDEQWRPCEP